MQTAETSLTSLLDKYVEMARLREEREVLEARGVLRLAGEAARQRRARTRRLAQSFPGALRELERLDAAAIAARIDRLRGAGAPLPPWARVIETHHRALRWALATKRRLSGQRRSTRGASDAPPAESGDGPLGLSSIDALCPPGGRLSAWVATAVARHFNLDAATFDVILYGAQPWEIELPRVDGDGAA